MGSGGHYRSREYNTDVFFCSLRHNLYLKVLFFIEYQANKTATEDFVDYSLGKGLTKLARRFPLFLLTHIAALASMEIGNASSTSIV